MNEEMICENGNLVSRQKSAWKARADDDNDDVDDDDIYAQAWKYHLWKWNAKLFWKLFTLADIERTAKM